MFILVPKIQLHIYSMSPSIQNLDQSLCTSATRSSIGRLAIPILCKIFLPVSISRKSPRLSILRGNWTRYIRKSAIRPLKFREFISLDRSAACSNFENFSKILLILPPPQYRQVRVVRPLRTSSMETRALSVLFV